MGNSRTITHLGQDLRFKKGMSARRDDLSPYGIQFTCLTEEGARAVVALGFSQYTGYVSPLNRKHVRLEQSVPDNDFPRTASVTPYMLEHIVSVDYWFLGTGSRRTLRKMQKGVEVISAWLTDEEGSVYPINAPIAEPSILYEGA